MARKAKKTLEDKVSKMDRERMKEWLPMFKKQYGADVSIEKIECVQAGIHGATYKVIIKPAKGRKKSHYLRLLLGSDTPVMMDGALTQAGQNYVDFWSDYGKMIGDAY
ncbi:MAG: hypothetical protein WC852_04025 [Candidatus Nanoarchaeia archaeon]